MLTSIQMHILADHMRGQKIQDGIIKDILIGTCLDLQRINVIEKVERAMYLDYHELKRGGGKPA